MRWNALWIPCLVAFSAENRKSTFPENALRIVSASLAELPMLGGGPEWYTKSSNSADHGVRNASK
jgi:hypothetical protein